ncbi:MAG: hypothetical protein LOY03_00660 [Cyclobacteriaceae bacterium]|nr:hypothetical protein [Cyclobacteriaceae bacterium]
MTITNHPVRRISGIALLALFLTFISVQVYPGTEEEADDKRHDESRLNVPSEPAVPIIIRNTKLGTSGLIDKASAGLLPSPSNIGWHVAITLRTATKETVPQLVSNPFYVVLTANAP